MPKIIVIEDSSLMRIRITRVLQQSGFHLVEEYDSADDIARSPQTCLGDADLIITDVRLPGMSGIELAKFLNAHPAYSEIPVIFLSSASDQKTISEAISAGAADFILKPFENQTLIGRVMKVLGEPIQDMEDYQTDEVSLKKVIQLEHERARRGGQPVSFLKYRTDLPEVQKCIMAIAKSIRKIDMIYFYRHTVYVILPLTDESGMHVVQEKILPKLEENSIALQSCESVTYMPQDRGSADELVRQLL